MASCKKDNPQPQYSQPTQTGANKFFCLVNGERFEAKGGLFLPAVLNQYWENGGKTLAVTGRVTDGNHVQKSLNIWIDSVDAVGVYPIRYNAFVVSNIVECEQYVDSTTIGSVNITTYNYDKRIISGTFNLNCPSYTITNGWFDIQWF